MALVLKEQEELKAQQVQVQLEHKEHLEVQEHKEQQVEKETQEHKEQKAQMVDFLVIVLKYVFVEIFVDGVEEDLEQQLVTTMKWEKQ